VNAIAVLELGINEDCFDQSRPVANLFRAFRYLANSGKSPMKCSRIPASIIRWPAKDFIL